MSELLLRVPREMQLFNCLAELDACLQNLELEEE